MKKFLKKHFNKFFIGILTLISAIAIGIGISSNYNKSYAYFTDNFSYTLNKDTIQVTSSTSNFIYDNSTNTFTNVVNTSADVLFSINSFDSIYYYDNYLLMNVGVEVSSDGVTWSDYFNNSYYLTLGLYRINNTGINYCLSSGSVRINQNNQINNNDNNYFCVVSNSYQSSSVNSNSLNTLYIYLSLSSTTSLYVRYKIYNFDCVNSVDIGLSQYYDTYYGAIEDNYNTLLSNYNTLNDNYNTLQSNYDTLETNYTNLNNDYANIQSLSQYGDFYGSQIRISGNNLTTINYNFNDLITNNIIINNSINFKTLLDHANINPVDTPCNVDFFLNSNLNVYVNQIYWNINNSNLSGFTADFELLDLLDETFSVSINSYAMPYTLDYRSFINDIVGNNVSLSNEKLESMSLYINYSLTNDFTISCSTQFQSGYNFGYNTGYSNGVDSSSDVINSLQDNVSSLNSQVNDLQSTINTQSNIITNLNQQVSDLAENNLGWQSIFFTMADTPLKVVHSVLLGDSGNWFFGVNLYSVFIGVIVALACIWIIKKFL